eukprot:589372-Rhodomonas_salina.1
MRKKQHKGEKVEKGEKKGLDESWEDDVEEFKDGEDELNPCGIPSNVPLESLLHEGERPPWQLSVTNIGSILAAGPPATEKAVLEDDPPDLRSSEVFKPPHSSGGTYPSQVSAPNYGPVWALKTDRFVRNFAPFKLPGQTSNILQAPRLPTYDEWPELHPSTEPSGALYPARPNVGRGLRESTSSNTGPPAFGATHKTTWNADKYVQRPLSGGAYQGQLWEDEVEDKTPLPIFWGKPARPEVIHWGEDEKPEFDMGKDFPAPPPSPMFEPPTRDSNWSTSLRNSMQARQSRIIRESVDGSVASNSESVSFDDTSSVSSYQSSSVKKDSDKPGSGPLAAYLARHTQRKNSDSPSSELSVTLKTLSESERTKSESSVSTFTDSDQTPSSVS